MTTTADSAKTSRRRFQVSLRTLLIVMLMASAFCGGWVAHEWRHRRLIEDDVQIEYLDSGDVLILRGTEKDVEVLGQALQEKMENADSP